MSTPRTGLRPPSGKLWQVVGTRKHNLSWFAHGLDSEGNGTCDGPFPLWYARALVWWRNFRKVQP